MSSTAKTTQCRKTDLFTERRTFVAKEINGSKLQNFLHFKEFCFI